MLADSRAPKSRYFCPYLADLMRPTGAESRKSIQIGYITGPFTYFDKVSVPVSPNMPAPAPALPPVAYQVAVISIALNMAMFLTFLMGLCSTTSYLHQHNLTVFRDLYNGLLWHRVPLWQVCLQL